MILKNKKGISKIWLTIILVLIAIAGIGIYFLLTNNPTIPSPPALPSPPELPS